MVDRAESKIRKQIKGAKTPKYFLYIPKKFAEDSAFPFAPNEIVILNIDHQNKRVLIEGIKKTETDKKN